MKSRTMVYLEPEQLQSLRLEARNQRISLAELMRRLVRNHLTKDKGVSAAPKEAYLKIVGLGSSGKKTFPKNTTTIWERPSVVSLLVDTGAWYAVTDTADRHHKEASRFFLDQAPKNYLGNDRSHPGRNLGLAKFPSGKIFGGYLLGNTKRNENPHSNHRSG